MVRIILSFVFCAALSASVLADSKSVPESAAMRGIARIARDYSQSHSGRIATNWSQLSEETDLLSLTRNTFPVTEYYVFVTDQMIALPERGMGNAYLIRTEPATNSLSEGWGRYIISLTDGEFILNWYTEDKIQKMLGAAKIIELPKAEPLFAQAQAPLKGAVDEMNARVGKRAFPPNFPLPPVETERVRPRKRTQIDETPSDLPRAVRTENSMFSKLMIVGIVLLLGALAIFLVVRPKK